jgi:hypothetical protein
MADDRTTLTRRGLLRAGAVGTLLGVTRLGVPLVGAAEEPAVAPGHGKGAVREYWLQADSFQHNLGPDRFRPDDGHDLRAIAVDVLGNRLSRLHRRVGVGRFPATMTPAPTPVAFHAARRSGGRRCRTGGPARTAR